MLYDVDVELYSFNMLKVIIVIYVFNYEVIKRNQLKAFMS